MNTRVDYMYRDASNYKIFQNAVLYGELTELQKADILAARYDGLWFIPSAVGLDAERFSDETDDDHCWFELFDDAFSETNESPSGCEYSASEFYDAFMLASSNWESYIPYY